MSSSKLAPRQELPRVVDNKFAKLLVIVNACVPAVILLWDALHHNLGVNEVNFAIRTTGLLGLSCLVLSLVITPLRRLTGWQTLIAIRRNLGVAGFSYISAHFIIFYWWDREGSVSSTVHEILTREYLWFGFGALVLMIPLAVTSTDAMVSWLGAKRWKQLHRLTYAIVLAGCVHYYLLVKSDVRPPAAFTSVVIVLLLFRLVAFEIDRKAARAKRLARLVAGPTKKKFWSGELEIARIFQETPDVKTFRFVNPAGGSLPFEHVAGQYLNLALTIDGKRVNRSYTIASPSTRQAYAEISVKRAADGYGSKHLHDTWKEGDRVKVSAPAGKFTFEPRAGDESDRVVLIAGGIGITPMMSVTRSLTDRGWRGEIFLAFSVRKRSDVVFETELEYLKARHPNLHVLVTLTNDPDPAWTGARGYITADVLRAFVPDFTHGPAMLCGPDPMMTAMRATLVGMGISDAEIHQEAFVSPPPIAEAASGEQDPALPDGETATLTFQRSGITATVTNATSVLEAAEDAGVAIPFECRSGICGQCKTRLIHGNVRMDSQDALSNQDRSKGLVLACQAHATRDCTLDA